MHTLSRNDRLNKRKGKFGSGWRKPRKDGNLKLHIFAKERWLVFPPGDNLPQAFFSEEKAINIANAIASKSMCNIEMEHQILNDSGEWVSSPDSE